MSALRTALIVGPGFIGWNVLDLLVADGYKVSGLIRRQSHADQIKASGGIPIQGDLDNADFVKKHVLENDVIIHTAGADHITSVNAILSGLKERSQASTSKSSTPPIFIHTSGTALLDDSSQAMYKSEKIYPDTDYAAINALSDTAPHRPVDLTIVRAAQELGSAARIAIMIPPCVYGVNPKHGRLSMQNPAFARFAMKHGYAGYVGKGLGVGPAIHVLDLARGYEVLVRYMEGRIPGKGNSDGKDVGETLLENPYFFCENGTEYSWKEVAGEIGKALHAKGKIADPRPKEFKREHWGDMYGDETPAIVGLNSRARAVRLRELGWEAKEKGIWESFAEDELPIILKE